MSKKKPAKRRSAPPDISKDLLDVRQRLQLVKSRVHVCMEAVGAEDSGSGDDIALILQHDVGDEIDRQVEVLERIAARIKEGGS